MTILQKVQIITVESGWYCSECDTHFDTAQELDEYTGLCFVCAFHKIGFPLDCWSIKTQYSYVTASWSTRMNYDDGDFTFEFVHCADSRQASIDESYRYALDDVRKELENGTNKWEQMCYYNEDDYRLSAWGRECYRDDIHRW